ncbi:MAG: hypothetical protein ACK4ZJ_16875, partial [Allorhizobium sp.]
MLDGAPLHRVGDRLLLDGAGWAGPDALRVADAVEAAIARADAKQVTILALPPGAPARRAEQEAQAHRAVSGHPGFLRVLSDAVVAQGTERVAGAWAAEEASDAVSEANGNAAGGGIGSGGSGSSSSSSSSGSHASPSALLVVEPLPGFVTLRQLLGSHGYLGSPRRLTLARYWCRQLLLAVRAAHQRGLLVRDLSPDNVLVSTDGSRVLIASMHASAPLDARGHATALPDAAQHAQCAPEELL